MDTVMSRPEHIGPLQTYNVWPSGEGWYWCVWVEGRVVTFGYSTSREVAEASARLA
jgi:hypothetical protein